MKKGRIYKLVILSTLLFMVLPAVPAHIDIVDIGHYYDGIDHLGYIDYQNVADYNLSGTILVYIDDEIVAGKVIEMPIRHIAGFRCSPIKTLEFPLNETEGDHTIVAYVYSMHSSAERTYEYVAEERWTQEPEENEEEEEDWLKCFWR